MAKIWRTLRTHPKKSLLLAGFTAYIYNYLEVKYTQDVLRRKFCSLAKPLGNVTVSPTDQLRRLTVFLNPFARRGNLLKEFEKNVAPILQLGGLDVQMVYTDNDTEIKDFVTVLDPTSTDGILIASDDHVLQKAVSALLQRTDMQVRYATWYVCKLYCLQTSRLSHLPIGIVPLGVWNTFARSISACRNPVE
ncbi:acylglycerol kinase [Paragonimus westermani]|uniref:Acylglycerol kinase n=1 Tax=Paragonimus westermani TaxID=34504 RepID=A0A5J4NEC7_9TREM|nr:acylglycerol kinase [Paragonimus westermani]